MQGYSPRRENVLACILLELIKQKRPKITKLFNFLEKNACKVICFGPKINSAILFRAEQPIKLHKKHSSPHKYMLIMDMPRGSKLLQ